jgi:cytochrome c oxidase subunit 2
MKGLPIARLVAAVIVLTVVTSVIMLIPNWNGEQASTAAPKIDTLLDVMIVLSSFVFSIVIVMLGYAVYKWRAKPGDESDGAPIHGNTRLEILWTAIPTVIVLFAAGYSAKVLADIEHVDPNPLKVTVTGQQFEWTFDYPEQGVTAHELHVPVDKQVEFSMRSLDVIHSFWVPEWRIKRDAVPGAPGSSIDSTFVVTPTREGDFTVICTELCGAGHSTMRAPVVVESEQDFLKWAAKQTKLPAGADKVVPPDTNGPTTQ